MNDNIALGLAQDLNSAYPRSPHDTLGGFVIAARALDKCRAVLAGTNGEYHFDCPLDNFFFGFSGISADAFKETMGNWIRETSSISEDAKKLWNVRMRNTRVSEMPMQLQLFLEGYIPEVIPANRRVYTWFDVYDIEEGRI
jgi:hypothetical protein